MSTRCPRHLHLGLEHIVIRGWLPRCFPPCPHQDELVSTIAADVFGESIIFSPDGWEASSRCVCVHYFARNRPTRTVQSGLFLLFNSNNRSFAIHIGRPDEGSLRLTYVRALRLCRIVALVPEVSQPQSWEPFDSTNEMLPFGSHAWKNLNRESHVGLLCCWSTVVCCYLSPPPPFAPKHSAARHHPRAHPHI